MTKLQKWTPERTDTLTKFVSDVEVVSQEMVAEAAAVLETTPRSVAAKLRKMGVEVQKADNAHVKAFSDEQEEALRGFLDANPGEYTFAEIATHFAGGAFTAKQIQGKVLSMEATGLVKRTPKKEYERSFNATEEAKFVKLALGGASLEKIAEALGREVAVIRGKALSLLRADEIESIPRSERVAVKPADPLSTLNVAEMEVAEISEAIQRSERGVKAMLTRRGLSAKDYDGAGKREKRDAKEAASA